jgi:hypothetical protein
MVVHNKAIEEKKTQVNIISSFFYLGIFILQTHEVNSR